MAISKLNYIFNAEEVVGETCPVLKDRTFLNGDCFYITVPGS